MAAEAKETTKEIESQQVLLPDGCVYSAQSIDFPLRFAGTITAPMLLERYLKVIRKWTLSVIRPLQNREGVKFTLFGSSISLLTFAPPERVETEDGDEVRLRIIGGVLVQAKERGRGMFAFLVQRRPEGLRVMVKLSDFCPLLLGTRQPSWWRKLLYRFSQAYVHELVTTGYLSHLYRSVTGTKARTKVRKVFEGEGKAI